MGTRKLTWGAVVGIVLHALVSGIPAAQADTARADIEDFAFRPNHLTIDVGDRVTWTNRGDETHTVTADDGSFDDDDIDPDDSYSKTFREEGRFSYRCTRHPEMTGAVEVVDETTAGALIPAPGAPATTSTTRATSPPTTRPPRPTPTPPVDRVPETTTPSATRSPDRAPSSTAVPTTARTEMTMPVLRSSTSTTAPAPVYDGQVTATTGEPPVFTPLPEELSAPPPVLPPEESRTRRSSSGHVGDGGSEAAPWGSGIVLGVIGVLALGATGFAGRAAVRRARRH